MPPPTKRRKTESAAIEEITFDLSARQEYLTGFHKRKLERASHARDLAKKQARVEKLEARKQAGGLRDERKADLERHVAEVNALLDPPEAVDGDGSDEDEDTAEEWNGVEGVPPIDHEAEYIDEDKYTTVTVEAMDLSRKGLQKVEQEGRKQGEVRVPEVEVEEATEPKDATKTKKWSWTKEKPRERGDKPKQKKKKFRYETKSERKFTRMKQGARNSREAKARREKA